MKYKNTKTGAVIDVDSKVSGENWEPVDSARSKKKKDNSEDKEEQGAE